MEVIYEPTIISSEFHQMGWMCFANPHINRIEPSNWSIPWGKKTCKILSYDGYPAIDSTSSLQFVFLCLTWGTKILLMGVGLKGQFFIWYWMIDVSVGPR